MKATNILRDLRGKKNRVGGKEEGRKEEKGNRVDVGSYPQHLSLHRTYGSRIRRYIHIGERKL